MLTAHAVLQRSDLEKTKVTKHADITKIIQDSLN